MKPAVAPRLGLRLLLPLLALALMGCPPGIDGADDDDATEPDDLDGDGFTNATEADAGSDPADPYSWPYESEQWPDFGDEAAAAGLSSDTWALGQTAPNATLTDQYGNDVELYDFYGHVIVVQLHAGWCGPSWKLGGTTQGFWEDTREDGLIVIHLIMEWNLGVAADGDDLAHWVDELRVRHPVVLDGTGDVVAGMVDGGIYEDALPTSVVIDRTMEVSHVEVGVSDMSQLSAIAEALSQARPF